MGCFARRWCRDANPLEADVARASCGVAQGPSSSSRKWTLCSTSEGTEAGRLRQTASSTCKLSAGGSATCIDSAGFGDAAASFSIDKSAGDGGETGSTRLGVDAEESVALFAIERENGARCFSASPPPMPGALAEDGPALLGLSKAAMSCAERACVCALGTLGGGRSAIKWSCSTTEGAANCGDGGVEKGAKASAFSIATASDF